MNSKSKTKRQYGSLLMIMLFFIVVSIVPDFYLLARKNGSLKDINTDDMKRIPKSLLKVISVTLENVPFQEALITVANKGNFQLNYSSTRLGIEKSITLKMKNVPAIKILKKILDGTGSELKMNRRGHFVIVPKRVKKHDGRTVQGKNGKISNIEKFELPDIEEFLYVTGNGNQSEWVDVRVINLSGEDIRRTPGAVWGVNRMLEVVPGVSVQSDINTDLIIRGGSPLENGFYVDNIQIPTIDHLPRLGSAGGFYSALNPELIQNIDLFSSGFCSNYGDHLSSIIDISLRDGNRKEFEGQFDFNMAMSGGVFEGPVGKKGSWLVSFRKSHLNFFREVGFDLQTFPETFDTQVKLVFDLSNMHKIRFLNFYGGGEFNQNREEPPFIHNRENDHYTTGMNIVSIWNRNFFSNTSVFFTLMNRNDEQIFASSELNESLWNLNSHERYLGIRNLNFLRLNPKSKFEFGFEIKHEWGNFDLSSFGMIDELESAFQEDNKVFHYETTKYGLFLSYRNTFSGKLDATIGLRGDYSSAVRVFHLSPRLNLTYRINPHFRLKGGLGIFYQSIPTYFLASVEDLNDVKDMNSRMATLGLEYFTERGLNIHLDVYHKEYENLPFNPDLPNIILTDAIVDVANDFLLPPEYFLLPASIVYAGKGYSSGIELLWQQNLSKTFFYRFNISYFRSRYKDLQGNLRNRIYDNRFLFNIMFAYQLNPNLKFAVNFTFLGGAPYTPVDIVESNEMNDYVLDQTKFLQERYPAYKSVSLRIDKRFLLKNSLVRLYLDILNVFDSDNVYYYYWNPYEGNLATENQINIIPVLGIKYEF